MSLVYDWETQRQVEDEILSETILDYFSQRGITPPADLGPEIASSEVNPFPHPPYIVPLLGLLAHLDYIPAYVTWTVIMSVLAALAALLLVRLVPQAQGRERWILFCGTFLFFPVFFSLLNGQDSAILLLASAVWFWGLTFSRDRIAGLGLGFVTIRPHMALVLAPLFLFKRRKVWWWFCSIAGILALISLLLLGSSGAENYLRILATSASGEGNKFFNEELMVNLIGFLRRLLPESSPASIRTVGWFGYLAAIVFLCIVWIRSGRIEDRHIGLAVILTILSVPHCHYHDLVLLLIPIYGCIRTLLEKKLIKVDDAVLVPLALSLIFFTTYLFLPVLKYTILYLVMALILLVLWAPEKMPFKRSVLEENRK